MKDSNEFIKRLTTGIRKDARREALSQKKFKSDLRRETIATDRYDRRTEQAARNNMRMYDKTVKRLGKKIDTGESACADTFQLVYKANPRDVPADEIDPGWIVNASVRDAMRSSDELRELRDAGTQGDELNSGLAVSTLADLIEATFDRLESERQAMEELRQQIREQVFVEVEIEQIEQEINDLQTSAEDDEGHEGEGADSDDGDGEGQGDQSSSGGAGASESEQGQGGGRPGGSGNDASVAAAQERLEAKQAAHRDLQEEIERAEKQLAQDLATKQPAVEADTKAALSKAAEEQRQQRDIANALSFGTEGVGQMRLSPEERMALGEKMRNNERLKQLAKLIGRFKTVAFAEQRIKAPEGTAKIVDVELGSDLMAALPNELAAFSHPLLKRDMLLRMTNEELLQYKTEGEAKVGLGSIILLEDGSGSMHGQRELFAKAMAGGLMNISYDQNRAFHAIHFGSRHQIAEFPFPDRASYTPQRVIEFYELFFGGGTDFVAPLSRALAVLQDQSQQAGNIKGDIVLITDGACTVPQEWLKEFKAEQERLGFHVFGIRIQAHQYGHGKDTLETICDGRVVDVTDLTSPDDVRSVFEGLHKPRNL